MPIKPQVVGIGVTALSKKDEHQTVLNDEISHVYNTRTDKTVTEDFCRGYFYGQYCAETKAGLLVDGINYLIHVIIVLWVRLTVYIRY